MDATPGRIEAFGTVTMPDALWDRMKKISAAVAPLAAQTTVGGVAVDAAALSLGISRLRGFEENRGVPGNHATHSSPYSLNLPAGAGSRSVARVAQEVST